MGGSKGKDKKPDSDVNRGPVYDRTTKRPTQKRDQSRKDKR